MLQMLGHTLIGIISSAASFVLLAGLVAFIVLISRRQPRRRHAPRRDRPRVTSRIQPPTTPAKQLLLHWLWYNRP